MRAPLSIIVAMTKSRVIGKAGGLPWRLPEDMQHFKATTMGHAIIMGRKTHESIGRALPGRRNLVVSHQPGLTFPGCEVFASLDEALAAARAGDPEPVIIGGAAIYALALPLATRLHLTEVQADVEGDTYFPDFDERAWQETQRRAGDGVVFRTLER
jgi:dihydrofolate reductase